MIAPNPVELERDRLRLEPMGERHRADLHAAAADEYIFVSHPRVSPYFFAPRSRG